jgi:hypothetical protein
LTIAASVVDLPEPVGPVTRTMPRGWFAMSMNDFGAVQFFEGQDLRRDGPHHGAGASGSGRTR